MTFEHRVLWADQLCINKYDLLERGNQVRMMNRIFENASQTIVWLGEEDEATSTVFELAKDSSCKFPKVQVSASDKHSPENDRIECIITLPPSPPFRVLMMTSRELLWHFFKDPGSLACGSFKKVWSCEDFAFSAAAVLSVMAMGSLQ